MLISPQRWLMLALCLLTTFFAGCSSDDGDGSGFVDDNVTPTSTIVYNTVLARAVPNSVTTYRFTGRDASDAIVFGPAMAPKQASLTLIVPQTLVNLNVDYLNSANEVVGVVNLDVNLSTGQTVTITDPDFTSPGGEAAGLRFVANPTNVGRNLAIAPAMTVAVEDANGGLVTGSTATVTLTLGANPGNATLGGTLTETAVGGIATFSDVRLNNAGNDYTLVASSTDLDSATSLPFDVLNPGAPTKLAFQATPTDSPANTPIPGVVVMVQDANGLTVPNANNVVTIAISGGTGALGGTTQVAAASGLATFNDLVIDTAGSFTFSATSPNLVGTTSNAFTITEP